LFHNKIPIGFSSLLIKFDSFFYDYFLTKNKRTKEQRIKKDIRTMVCLVQQLFRQKIGQELDQHVVDEVLFPMLRLKKHPSKELLLDIKLTQSCNEYGRSAIVGRRGLTDPNWHKNISPFPESIANPNIRRCLRRVDTWGSIDILNELRSLKQPLFGQRRVRLDGAWKRAPGDEFGGIYILLDEVPPWSCRQEKRLSDLKFMNDYLDDALNTGKCISWGGDNITPGRKILSTHY
jgi:hypothetical protein